MNLEYMNVSLFEMLQKKIKNVMILEVGIDNFF